jgi:hypothetical protein
MRLVFDRYHLDCYKDDKVLSSATRLMRPLSLSTSSSVLVLRYRNLTMISFHMPDYVASFVCSSPLQPTIFLPIIIRICAFLLPLLLLF